MPWKQRGSQTAIGSPSWKRITARQDTFCERGSPDCVGTIKAGEQYARNQTWNARYCLPCAAIWLTPEALRRLAITRTPLHK